MELQHGCWVRLMLVLSDHLTAALKVAIPINRGSRYDAQRCRTFFSLNSDDAGLLSASTLPSAQSCFLMRCMQSASTSLMHLPSASICTWPLQLRLHFCRHDFSSSWLWIAFALALSKGTALPLVAFGLTKARASTDDLVTHTLKDCFLWCFRAF